MTTEVKKIPKKAMVFADLTDIALSEDDDKKIRMEAYSGKIIEDHFWWGNLVLDVEGIQLAKTRIPILEQHDLERKIGVSNSAPDRSNNSLLFDNIKLLSNSFAQEFKQNLDDGFPYQASVRVRPIHIEELEKGAQAEVNGFTFKGPGTIFRKSVLKEASVCVFGYDSRTSVSAFADDQEEEVSLSIDKKYLDKDSSLNKNDNNSVADNSDTTLSEKEKENDEGKNNKNNKTDGGKIMNLEELKDKNPELYASVTKHIETELAKKDAEIEKKNNEITQLQESKKEADTRLSVLEKNEAIRTEKELRASAEYLKNTALSESTVPANMYDKVKQQVNHTSFVDDKGVFDAEAFKTAFAEEVKDWEARLSESFSQKTKIKGMTTPTKGSGEDESFSDDNIVERMLGYVGHKEASAN